MSKAVRSRRKTELALVTGLRDSVAVKAIVLAFAVGAVGASLIGGVDYLSRPDAFPVQSIRLEGEFRQVSEAEILNAVTQQVQGNFFLLDLDAVRERAEALPWVRRAAVRRWWPQSVHIRFSEHQPIARWSNIAWLNSYGEVVELPDSAPAGLPRLAGPDGTHATVLAHYRRLNELAKSAGLDVLELELSDRRTWKLRLSNDLALVLGRGEPDVKLARFLAVYDDMLAHRVEQIRQVDLRYTNGFSVEWAGGPVSAAGGRNEG